ncbi:MAG: M14 family zinc carboxypeptidase [Flavobacteriaceae bacterium]
MKQYELYENRLFGRYVSNEHIEPIIETLPASVNVEKAGSSVRKKSIYTLTFGTGTKRILMWSQMHGNESTCTKAVFDVLKLLQVDAEQLDVVLLNCTICVIPILNPDGAEMYTRLNANKVDLNRDAQKLSQPESLVLKRVFEEFKPHYCFNLHGQRTIFSAGYSNLSSVMSFLSPAESPQRAVTQTRKIAMEVILAIHSALKTELPNQISRYDDGFNANCVGDAFQMLGVPTILFEAGHYPGDYNREVTRKLMFKALLEAFTAIATTDFEGDDYQDYFKLPENRKLFFDVLIRNVKNSKEELVDIAIQYEEVLESSKVMFKPKIERIGDLSEYFGHHEIDGENNHILINNSNKIDETLSIIKELSINNVDFISKITIN